MGLGNSGCTGDLFLAYSWNLCFVHHLLNLDGLLAALLQGGEVCWYALLISCHSWESAAFSWLGIHHSLLNCNYIIIDLLFIFNSFAPSSSHPPPRKNPSIFSLLYILSVSIWKTRILAVSSICAGYGILPSPHLTLIVQSQSWAEYNFQSLSFPSVGFCVLVE